MTTMNRDAVAMFTDTWIRDWNARDLDAILAHYADDVEFRSPTAAEVVGLSTIGGKAALAAYWRTALARHSALHFTLDRFVWDAEAAELVIVYIAERSGQRRRACESFRFGPAGLVVAGEAMYGAELG